jgi:hypothetical protein
LAPEEASDCREIRLEGLLFGQGRVSVDGGGATPARRTRPEPARGA